MLCDAPGTYLPCSRQYLLRFSTARGRQSSARASFGVVWDRLAAEMKRGGAGSISDRVVSTESWPQLGS